MKARIFAMKPCIRSGFGPALALAALASALPAFADVVPVSALRGKKALFVVGEDKLRDDENKEHHSDDRLVKAHLEALGFVVKVARETEPPSAATGLDLVVISSTVDASALNDAYKNVAVPVLTWSAYSYPHMAMTGPEAHRDFEVLFKGVQGALYRRSLAYAYAYGTNAVNPIAKAAGVPNLLFGLMGLEDGKCWGRPSASADTVVTFEGDAGKAALFTYEKGALMHGGFVAPARRVGFPLDNDSFHSLTGVLEGSPGDRDRRIKDWYVGRKLFDASVRWAVTPPPAPPEAAQIHGALTKAAPGKKVLFLERTNFAAVYAPLPGNLTVYQNLRIFGLMYAVKQLKARIETLIDQFDLEKFRNVKCGVRTRMRASLLGWNDAIPLGMGRAPCQWGMRSAECDGRSRICFSAARN